MGRFNKYSDGVGDGRSAAKKYLLGADRLRERTASKVRSPTEIAVSLRSELPTSDHEAP